MKTFENIKKILEQQKEFLKNKYKIKEIGIFGSFVRGDATEDSDVDILVEFEEVPSFFKFIEIENYLSNILGIKVDLVEKSPLNLV